jgi:alkylation response protein AidB-like acyl-CoA dehydrogenase
MKVRNGFGNRRSADIFAIAAGDPRRPGKPDRYQRQPTILVPPTHSGLVVKRILMVFDYGRARRTAMPRVVFDNARVPAENMLLGGYFARYRHCHIRHAAPSRRMGSGPAFADLSCVPTASSWDA